MSYPEPCAINWSAALPAGGASDDYKMLCMLSLMTHLDTTPRAFLELFFASDIVAVKTQAGHCLSPTRGSEPLLCILLRNVWTRFSKNARVGLVSAIDPIVKEIMERESKAAIECRQLKIMPEDVDLDSLLDRLSSGDDGIAHKIRALMPHPFDWLLHATSADNAYRRKLRAKDRLSAQSSTTLPEAEDETEGDAFPLHGEDWHTDYPGFSRDPRLAVTFSLCSLAFVRNRASNALPLLVSAQMAVHGANTRVNDTYSRFGAAVSRRTLDRFRERLSEDAIARGIAAAHADRRFLEVLDNVDLQIGKANQRIHNRTSMIHITNWAQVMLHSSVPLGSTIVSRFLKNRGKRAAAKPGDIKPTPADDDYTIRSFEALVQVFLVDNAPGAAEWSHRKQLRERALAAMPSLSPLAPEVTRTFPLGVVDANEGSNKGVIEALDLLRQRLAMSKETWGEHLHPIAGDFLTIRNIRSARHLRQGDVDGVERLETIMPQAQLFHFSLNAADMLLTAYLGDAIHDAGSLSKHKDVLLRKFNVNKADYANAKALIRHSLIARILQCVAQLLGYSTWDKFKSWKPTYTELQAVSAKFVRTFATPRAAAAAQAAGDDVLAHSIHFMNDALRFCDFESAVSNADAERVLTVLKYWTFEFRGAGRHNYARECAEILLHWKYELDEDQRKMWAAAWFVNRWGKPGRFIATDLYLEHLNYYVKVVHVSDGSGLSVDNIIKKGSACIEALRDISLAVSRFVGSSLRRRRSKEMRFEDDLRVLFYLLQENQVHVLSTAPDRFLPAPTTRGRGKKAASKPQSSIHSLYTLGIEGWNTKWRAMLVQSTYDPELGACAFRATGSDEEIEFSAADLGLNDGEAETNPEDLSIYDK